MTVISIGGLPAAGKTYTSKLLAEQYECISFEFESLRWAYFHENLKENLYKYTHNEKILPNETMREYYMRCTLYEKKLTLDELVEWHKNTMEFISGKIIEIIDEFNELKSEEQYESFCESHENIINYKPVFENLNRQYIICSHAFINTIDFGKFKRIKMDFNSDYVVLSERFKEREKITGDIKENIQLYYSSYDEVLKESKATKLDTTDCKLYNTINNLLKVEV